MPTREVEKMKTLSRFAILAAAFSLALTTPGRAEKTYGSSGQMIQKQGVPGMSRPAPLTPSYRGPSTQISGSSVYQRSYSSSSAQKNISARDSSGYSVSKSNTSGQLLSKTGSSRSAVAAPSHERPDGPYYRYQGDNRGQNRDDRSHDNDHNNDSWRDRDRGHDRDHDRDRDSRHNYFSIGIGGDGYSLYYSNLGYRSGYYGAYSVSVGSPYYYSTYYPTYTSYGRVWAPGYWTTRSNRVLVTGVYDSVWVAPAYDWVWDGYQYQWVVVQVGYYNQVPRYSTTTTRVWVPGCWR